MSGNDFATNSTIINIVIQTDMNIIVVSFLNQLKFKRRASLGDKLIVKKEFKIYIVCP